MIREATRADWSRISEIRLAVHENRLSDSKSEAVRLAADWLFDNSTFWVWEEDGAIQGFSAADPRDGWVFALFVDPLYEGRGIGRTLLPLACETLRASGHATAKLSTDPGTRAERFYRMDGWTEAGWQKNGEIIFQKGFA
jgi:GNAT superfamily N-acetyltransferase